MSSEDSEGSEENDLENLKWNLHRHLSCVSQFGSFATFRKIDKFVNPGVSIDESGIIRLPLAGEDAQMVIDASSRAPFGYRNQTLVDESIRKTWEIDSARVTFKNEEWDSYVQELVGSAAFALGCGDRIENIEGRFYEMLLYTEGSMFKPHQEFVSSFVVVICSEISADVDIYSTEKIPGMFGTLIICLPSAHKGGTVQLRHGSKVERYNTDQYSAFNASAIAWYADVIHEIEPVKSGHRWVLVYNLVNTAKKMIPLAAAQDTRIAQFIECLSYWTGLPHRPISMISRLDHKYTTKSLNVKTLKGQDYHCVRFAASCCQQHGDFFVLLANMEQRLTHTNSEEVDEDPDSQLYLIHVANLEGFPLLRDSTILNIGGEAIIGGTEIDHREPDEQPGGEYVGNQYVEIDQWYLDSVAIFVHKSAIAEYLLGTPAGGIHLHVLTNEIIQSLRSQHDQPQLVMLLRALCQSALQRTTYQNQEQIDEHLGAVAVAAEFLRDEAIFVAAVSHMKRSFLDASYAALGASICLQELSVPEDSLISAFGKSQDMHRIVQALDAFQTAFDSRNPERDDDYRVGYLHRWVDHIIFNSLISVHTALKEDAPTMVKIINDRNDHPFRQFVLYQGVREFIQSSSDNTNYMNALLVELLHEPQRDRATSNCLETLLKLVLEHAVDIFDLSLYITYSKEYVDRHVSRNVHRDKKHCATQLVELMHTFYQSISALGEDRACDLLRKIQIQVTKLEDSTLRDVAIPILGELLPVIDLSSSAVSKCLDEIISVYATRIIGMEPAEPRDWNRESEIVTCYNRGCSDCPKVNEFLKCSNTESIDLTLEDFYHVKSYYKTLKFSESKTEPVGFSQLRSATITKTSEKWKSEYNDWKARLDIALSNLHHLPQDKLKAWLGDRYEKVVHLDMCRLEPKEHQPFDLSPSFVPQKRLRDE